MAHRNVRGARRAGTAWWPLLATAISATAVPAYAQQVEGEIIVVARKREEALNSVPISITSLSADTMAATGVTNLEQIDNLTPNLIIQQGIQTSTSALFSMRSQNQLDSAITLDQSIGVYLDGVYVARNASSLNELLDIQRVEVLRGPQGTLYGRNTTGGAVNIIGARPTDEFTVSALVGFGDYVSEAAEGEPFRYEAQAIVNIPLAQNFATRLAVSYIDDGGYGENTGTGRPLNDAESWNWRSATLWEPNANLSFYLVGDGSHVAHQGRVAYVPRLTAEATATPTECFSAPTLTTPCAINLFLTGNAWAAALADGDVHLANQNPGYGVTETAGIGLTTEIDISGVTLRNVTAWRQLNTRNLLDLDGTPYDIFLTTFADDQTQYSTEFTLLGGNDRFDWSTGAIYFHETGTSDAVSTLLGFLNPTNPRSTLAEGTNWSAGVYAQGEYHFEGVDGLSLEAGLRYTYEERELIIRSAHALACLVPASLNLDLATGGCRAEVSKDFHGTTWLVGLNYQVSDDTLVYGKVSRGYRSGGFNHRAQEDPATFLPFSPETVLEYEVGGKFTLGVAQLNVAAFYDDYQNIQRTISIPGTPDPITGFTGAPISVVRNAASATVYGGEAELSVRPTDRLTLQAGLGVSIARYDEFDGGFLGDLSDRRFINAPDYTANALVSYDLPLGENLGEWTISTNYSWRSRIETAALNERSLSQDAYGLLGARLNIKLPTERPIEFALFGENLTDEEYLVSGVDLIDAFGYSVGYLGPSRFVGAELRMSWP